MISFPNAKINLGLKVLNRRSDGYHNIDSIFIPIPITDVLEIILQPGNAHLEVLGDDLDTPVENNLVWVTYQRMQRLWKIPDYQIVLYKNIPAGGGLGGGSADVGFLIRMIQDAAGLKLGQDDMHKLALEIGSDCPFFIQNVPAMVGGRGEVIRPIENIGHRLFCVVLFSQLSVSTAKAYSHITPGGTGFDWSGILADPSCWKNEICNDFAGVVYAEHPVLAENEKELYRQGAVFASLTGTGGAQYGFFEKEPEIPNSLSEKVLWKGWINVPAAI